MDIPYDLYIKNQEYIDYMLKNKFYVALEYYIKHRTTFFL
jgi:hypothetical protein